MLCLKGVGRGYDFEFIFFEFLLEFWKDLWEELGCIIVEERLFYIYE